MSISEAFNFLISLTPLFIVSFLFMASVLNQNVKGLVYLGGIVIVILITIGLKYAIGATHSSLIDTKSMWGWPGEGGAGFIKQNSIPDFGSMILSFTMMYITLPMAYKAASLNVLLIIIMLFFIVSNAVVRVQGKKNDIIGIIIGNLVGAALGVGYFFAFWASNNKNLLFNNGVSSNNVSCDRPSKQTFKCAVYKNGQIVKNL